MIDYPQQPVPQSWMVDYPLLAYKTVTPMNREIAIVNMVHNMPQKIIHLGQWEFVSFVNHTQSLVLIVIRGLYASISYVSEALSEFLPNFGFFIQYRLWFGLPNLLGRP